MARVMKMMMMMKIMMMMVRMKENIYLLARRNANAAIARVMKRY